MMFAEMVLNGFDALKLGVALRDLVHEMDLAVEAVASSLRERSTPLLESQISELALTASLGDQIVGRVVEEAVRKAGVDGVVLLEDSSQLETTIGVKEGMYFDRGFVSNKFISDEPSQLAVLDDAYVLLCADRVTSMKHLLPVLEKVVEAKKALLIVADDIDGEALDTLILNNARGSISAVAVKAPGYAASRQELLEDIAVVTGGVVVRASALENISMSQFGFVKRVEVTRDSTWITEGGGKRELIASRAAGIRRQIEVNRIAFEVEKLMERLAKLTGATAVIRVGGASIADRDERKYRITSALHSVRLALKDKVLLGGGAALWHSRRLAEQVRFKAGGRVISKALQLPIHTHIKNAGLLPSAILSEIGDNPSLGFDAGQLIVTDMRMRGIFDPLTITIRALQIAFGHAREVLQTGAWDITALKLPVPAPSGGENY
jgi:chaperonin GroEL